MTAEEWQRAEKALDSLFGYVKLQVDQYAVSIHLERIAKHKLALVVYINGIIDWKLIDSDTDERRRFYCRKTKSLLTAKGKAVLKKQTKKFQKEYAAQHQLEYAYWTPYWNSFRSMKSHFIKNNPSIEVIEIVGGGSNG